MIMMYSGKLHYFPSQKKLTSQFSLPRKDGLSDKIRFPTDGSCIIPPWLTLSTFPFSTQGQNCTKYSGNHLPDCLTSGAFSPLN